MPVPARAEVSGAGGGMSSTLSMVEHRLRTSGRVQMLDITRQVADAVRARRVRGGICVVYCPHTTAAITINENADPDVVDDMNSFLRRLIPKDANFAHAEGNSDSHIKTALVGPSQTLIIHDGDLVLGRWQGVYFCEFDGPRDRVFYTKVINDPDDTHHGT